jgi:hypothetical protein
MHVCVYSNCSELSFQSSFVLWSAGGSTVAADRNETMLTTLNPLETSITASQVSLLNGTVDMDGHHSVSPSPIAESVAPPNATLIEASSDYIGLCPSNIACDRLGADCINCDFNTSCHYGRNVSVVCHAKQLINCTVNEADGEK